MDIYERMQQALERRPQARNTRLYKIDEDEWKRREYGWIQEQTGQSFEEIEAELTAPDVHGLEEA